MKLHKYNRRGYTVLFTNGSWRWEVYGKYGKSWSPIVHGYRDSEEAAHEAAKAHIDRWAPK